MREFRKYTVWQVAFQWVKALYIIADKLPSSEKFGLVSQMTRAVVSIPSNIAEGCSRNSDIEFKRYLEKALGSSFESETQILLCADFQLMNDELETSLIERIYRNQAEIKSFILKIKIGRWRIANSQSLTAFNQQKPPQDDITL